MKVILAEKIGFCFGVKRAIQKVLDASEKEENIFTFGPLVHNKQFVKKLEELGVKVLEDVKKINKDTTIIIRAHGVSPKIMNRIKKRGVSIIDGTCPKVLRIHKLVKRLEKEGYQVLIIGNKGHPEIQGILGNIKRGIVIDSLEDIESLENFAKVAVVSQTTEEINKFDTLTKALRKKYPNIEIHRTICDATDERQKGAIKTAKESDCMVVIGGKHSSNTTHLADICSKIRETYHIEAASELDQNWFSNSKTIGVTAGASTPDFIIDSVVWELERA